MQHSVDAARYPIRDLGYHGHANEPFVTGSQAPDYEILDVRDPAGLDPFTAELDALAGQAIEANVFYEPWVLRAALEHLKPVDAHIILVRHRRDGITGVFPFQLQSRLRGLPVRNLTSWRHPYCFLRTPIVSRIHGRATLRVLFTWLESREAPARVVEFDLVAGDGPFWTLLSEEARARGWAANVATFERAAFAPSAAVQTALSKKHLKELRRLERRLGERGVLAYRALQPNEPVQPWLDRFLDLEASGWKGRAGTAISSEVHNRAFFASVAASAHARGQIQMLAIELDDVPVAMKCNFLAGDSAFAFKIAYDEDLASYSPGVLLELFNMRHLHEAHSSIRSMDSCAIPNHPMINRVWAGRRTIATCVMVNRGLARILIRHWARLRSLRRMLKWRVESD